MSSAAIDYRTANGVSRRRDAESVLDKYIRVARIEAPYLSQTYPLPIARPKICAAVSFADYALLLDVLDELFILESAARFADRKAGEIARRRLYNALSAALGCDAWQIEKLFKAVDRTDLPTLRAVAAAILPEQRVQDGGDGGAPSRSGDNVVPFPLRVVP